MKFRKRITILPGVRLNLSGSGVSLTAGPPGLSVNVGKRGAYLNTGVPGTGLYERTRLDRPGGGRGTAGSTSGRQAGASTDEEDLTRYTGDELAWMLDLRFAVEEDGTVGTFLPDGSPLADPRLLRKVRRSDAFRSAATELRESFVEDLERERRAILGCAAEAPSPISGEALRRERDGLRCREESPRPYQVALPSEEAIRAELTARARRAVPFWPPWSRARRRREFVAQRLPGRLAEERSAWDEARRAHERQEAERVVARNREHRRVFAAARRRLDGLLAGTPEVVSEELDRLLSGLSYPLPLEVETEVDEDASVSFSVDLPEIEDLPQETARILASGKLSIRDAGRRQLERDYATAVAAVTLLLVAHAFAASPAVPRASLHGVTQRTDPATGHQTDVSVVDVTCDRRRFATLNLAAGDPTAMLRGFDLRIDPAAAG